MFLVKKFCDMVGVNYSTLRHYERIGLLKPHQDEENGYRKYTPEDAFLVNVFKYYRSLGYDTKTVLKLVHEPEKEYVREQLLERETELIKEMIQMRNRMKAVQRQLEDLAFMGSDSRFRIGVRKDLWFLPVSSGYDFNPPTSNGMEDWVELLPLTRYAKYLKLSNAAEDRETNEAAYGMSIEAMSSFLLAEESLQHAVWIPGGKCLFYYSTTLGSPMSEAKILDEISEYLREKELEIHGDIYIEGVRIWDDEKQRGQMISIPIIEKEIEKMV